MPERTSVVSSEGGWIPAVLRRTSRFCLPWILAAALVCCCANAELSPGPGGSTASARVPANVATAIGAVPGTSSCKQMPESNTRVQRRMARGRQLDLCTTRLWYQSDKGNWQAHGSEFNVSGTTVLGLREGRAIKLGQQLGPASSVPTQHFQQEFSLLEFRMWCRPST